MNYLRGMAGGTAQPPAPPPDDYDFVNEGASIISNNILTGATHTRQEGGRSLHGDPTGKTRNSSTGATNASGSCWGQRQEYKRDTGKEEGNGTYT